MKTFSLFEEYSTYSHYGTDFVSLACSPGELKGAPPFLAIKCQANKLTECLFFICEGLRLSCMFLYEKCFKKKSLRNLATRLGNCTFLQCSIVKFINSLINAVVGAFLRGLSGNISTEGKPLFFNLLAIQMGNIYLYCGLIPHAKRIPDGTKKSERSKSSNRKIRQIMESETRWFNNPVSQKLRRKAY